MTYFFLILFYHQILYLIVKLSCTNSFFFFFSSVAASTKNVQTGPANQVKTVFDLLSKWTTHDNKHYMVRTTS